MLKVGLTGGIASGKSYVLERFRRRGVACVDADELAHGVLAAGTEASAAVAARFGPEMIGADGAVDRARLGPVVFADGAARRDLEAIVHPAVYRAIGAAVRGFERLGEPLVVVDVPLLFETGHAGDFDRVIVTACTTEQQLERLAARGIGADAARLRLAAQAPAADKVSRADFVIQTGGRFADTDAQVDRVLEELRNSP